MENTVPLSEWMLIAFIVGFIVGGGPVLLLTLRLFLPLKGDFSDLLGILGLFAGVVISFLCGLLGGIIGACGVYITTRYGLPGLATFVTIIFFITLLSYGAYALKQQQARALCRTVAPLVERIRSSDPEGVRALLKPGTMPNTVDALGRTPFLWAVLSDKAEIVDLLLKGDADVHAAHNTSALIHAADQGNREIVRLLLAAGANPDTQAGKPPLHHAVHRNDLEMAEALLESGANIEAADHEYKTPLMHAAGLGNLSMVRLLLKYKADVSSQTKSGATPLGFTVNREAADQPQIAAMLLDHGAECEGARAERAQKWAMRMGYTELVKRLNEGIDITPRDK